QQRYAPAGGDAVGDHLEAAMGVDQLDDGHGAEQEEQDLGDLTQVMTQRTDHYPRGVRRVIGVQLQGRQYLIGPQHQYRPGQGSREDRSSGLVEPERMLQRDTEVTHYKNDRHQHIHQSASLLLRNHRNAGLGSEIDPPLFAAGEPSALSQINSAG